MSVHEVERFLFQLNSRPELADAFAEDAAACVSSWDGPLEIAEQELLVSADVSGLYRHGVHPVLLAVAASSLGLSAQEVRVRLKRSFGLDDEGRPVGQEGS